MIFEIKELNNKSYTLKTLLVFVFLLILILIGFRLFKKPNIVDKCDSLYVGETCQFEIADNYTIEIDDESIVKFEQNMIRAYDKGSSIIRVKDKGKVIYEKKIVAFSK